jgi:hypothetical protein
VEDLELYVDEEEEAVEEEGANRTFMILVGVLGGLLALGICAFAAWALWLGPRMAAQREADNEAILATNAAIEAGAAAIEGATIPPTEESTIAQTDTPQPTSTKPPAATAAQATETPEPEEGTEAPGAATATPAQVAEVTATPPSPTATRRPTATPKPSDAGVPDTGIGALGGGALAVGLLFLLLVVRRMRRAM